MTLDFFPFPLLIGAVILIVVIIILWKQKHSFSHLFCFSLFWIYILLLVNVTIFPIPLHEDISIQFSKQQVTFTLSHVNIVPFKYFTFFNKYGVFREIIRNILLTIPFGFGICFIAPLRAKNFIWLSIAVGLVIETTQLAISLGIAGAYRTVDITDVLLNAVGVLLGFLLFKAFAWWYLRVTQQPHNRRSGFSAYIYSIASRMSD